MFHMCKIYMNICVCMSVVCKRQRDQDRLNLFSSFFSCIITPFSIPTEVSNVNNIRCLFPYFYPYLHNPIEIYV